MLAAGSFHSGDSNSKLIDTIGWICYAIDSDRRDGPEKHERMDRMKKLAVVDRRVCVACGVCMKACPKGAISIYRGCYAAVDAGKCVGCGLCAKACPAGCIAAKERSEAK